MKRRSFLASCTAAAGGLSVARAAAAAGDTTSLNGAFKDAPLRFSLPPGWFNGSFEEKLDQIAALGVPGYEILNPGMDPAEMRRLGDARGLQLSCIGGAGRIEPGHMVRAEDHDKVEQMFRERVVMAKTLGVKVLIGLTGNVVEGLSDDEMTANSIACLKRLAPIAEENDVVIVMEALNVLVNHGGFFLTRTDQTMAMLEAVGSPNVKMCYDIYHQQITEGNLIRNFTENMERIGHFHVGDNPGRQEPGTGEINYYNVFKAIYEEGYAKGRYDGFVTFECGNSKDTPRALNRILDCLDWA
ncbi:MAG: TIM barrel protein [Candidatus Hydrogenedentes bacterium]|nr:TIM barrel protein [Candidatus Hydrogenedentota bacterium]